MSNTNIPESNLIHPKTATYIEQTQLVFQYFVRGLPTDYIQALKTMDLLIRGLKPNDKPEELRDIIRKEILTLESYKFTAKRDRRINALKPKYLDWFESIDEVLHVRGYYSGTAFKVPVATAGEAQSGKQDYKPMPKQMRNEVREQ
jgi:hypothetical protein